MSFENSHGKKFQKIFQSFGLDIISIEEKFFLTNYWALPFEKNKTEYRVTLGKIFTLDDLEDDWSCRSEEEFLEKYKNSDLNEFKKDLQNVGKVVDIDRHELTFSIFVPPKTDLNKDKELAHLATWQTAALYFIILKNTVQCVYDKGHIRESDEILHEDDFGKFLTTVGAKITNANIKEALDYAYRLYKDSKFFYELAYYMGDGSYADLIHQLEKVKMKLKGQKKRQLFEELILPNLPQDLHNYVYVEPFGGTFAIASYLPSRPKKLIYNDIVKYNFELEIKPDLIFHTDYTSILKMYDQSDVIFYLDPPYVDKEDWYGLEKSNLSFHNSLYLALCEIKNAKVLLSYENNRLINALYKDEDFKIIAYTGNRQNFKKELLIIKK